MTDKPAPEPQAVDHDVMTTTSEQRAVREGYEAEIAALKAALAVAENHIEELQEKCYPDTHCACSYDNAGDVCMKHSPTVHRLRAENERLKAEVERLMRISKTALFDLAEVEEKIDAEITALNAEVERLTKIIQDLEDPHQAALDAARKEKP